MRHFIKGKRIAVDTETTGLKVWQGDQPFLFSFCNEVGVTYCFEWKVNPRTRKVQCNLKELKQIKDFMSDPSIEKIFHNAKFDIRIMENAFQIKTAGVIHDTMFLAHIFNSLEISFGLNHLANKYLHYPVKEAEQLHKETIKARREGKKKGWELGGDYKRNFTGELTLKTQVHADYWMVKAINPSSDICKTYALCDVERTMLLYQFYVPIIKKRGDWKVYEHELELWPVTYAMEKTGVKVNPVSIDREVTYYKKRHKEELIKLRKWAGTDINYRSAADLRILLYKTLKLPVTERTPTGLPATHNKAVLAHVDHPAIQALTYVKTFEKAVTGFLYNFEEYAVKEGNEQVIHMDFNQVGAATGRYSCRRPNMQNVPSEATTSSRVPIRARIVFEPRSGYRWYAFDYMQLEILIFADVSQEPELLRAIANHEDIHSAATNKAWGGKDNHRCIDAAIRSLELNVTGEGKSVKAIWKAYGIISPKSMTRSEKETVADDWVSKFDYDIVKAEASLDKKRFRSMAKMILFAKVFGGGPNAIRLLLRCTYTEAETFLADYDIAFPRIGEYIIERTREGRRDGYIYNCYGRRLTVHYDKAYRAVNYTVQGSAADLLKRGMIKCHNYLQGTGLDARLIMTIHDELVFEIRKDHAFKKMLRKLKELMEDNEGAFGIATPVDVCRHDAHWAEESDVSL